MEFEDFVTLVTLMYVESLTLICDTDVCMWKVSQKSPKQNKLAC